MSKIVFFCIPAHGHTNPTLGVVKELVKRGHEVWYYSYTPFREKIESLGAKFIACDDYDMEQRLDPKDAVRVGKDLSFSTQLLVDTTLALDDMVCRDMQQLKPDCIVADSMAVWGKAVAFKLGIPFISSTTTFAFNQYSAKIMKQSMAQMFGMIFSMPKINKNIKRLQDKGYPIKNVLDIIQNDNQTNTIVYTSPEFQPCAETFSDKYTFVGPSIRPVTEEIQKTKEKLIYISMGTVVNDSLDFYKKCIAAFTGTDYQVIMSVGNLISIEDLGVIPENISVQNFVDQIAVLNKADVFLSHCGMNSVNESLYYQVPLIMYPQTSEQSGVAARVEQLGAGIPLHKVCPAAIREAAEQVLHTSSYRENATVISDGFKKCSGAKGAADKIERLCQ
ncbi:MAG: glucosyltransferase [Bacillus sp. (in: Bacteria)]|nr:glucosyltransferase [Bacillus sp. (in: firmicutes)]MCM1427794.1 glucosyltransferase [Eubacterium sp.]